MKNIGYGAYDNFAGVKEISSLAQRGAKIKRVVPLVIPHSRSNPQLQGWASDTANKLGVSMWEYFKPMLPWFIVSNLITAIVIWKIASLFCSGRMAWGAAKRGIKSGVSSVTGAVRGAGRSIGSAGRAAKAKVGLKKS